MEAQAIGAVARHFGRHQTGLPLAFAIAIAALLGCREPLLAIERPPVPDPPVPRLPAAPGDFAPAHTAVDGEVTGEWLSDVETCGGCHADVFAQQQASAHAYSSFNNPVYRYSADALRTAVGIAASRMCAGCHDSALLVDGAIDAEIDPADPRAHAGVTCRVCHGISEATVDGNGSYTIARGKISLPNTKDPASVAAHKRSAAPLSGKAMCGSCHRGFLSRATGNSHFLPGMDELSGHAKSAYANGGLGRVDSVETKDCIGCHMPKVAATRGDAAAEDGTISSHRFAGGHTWLAAMLGDDEQLAAQRAMLKGVVSLDIAAARSGDSWSYPAERVAIAPGRDLEFDVVMRNLGVGHRFPAGVLDAQDTFLSVTVIDSTGLALGASGERHRAGEREAAHILRALVADQDGRPRLARDVHNFAATVVNHTIAPRDAAVVRFKLAIPKGVALPLTVRATLVHRSRNATVAKLACAAAKSERGRAFDATERALGRSPLDPCVAPPLTDVATAQVDLGRPAAKDGGAPTIERLYVLGLALSHAVSERLQEARAPLELALGLARPLADPNAPRRRAQIFAALAAVAGRQGRTDEALEFARDAADEIGETPALAKIRGDALSRVWRWKEAESELAAAAAGAPGNSDAWRALAIARGSLGDHQGALAAAKTGLRLSPRDADMLRVQALAVRALGASDETANAALEAYDLHRPPDRAGDIRIQCAATVPDCALERQPVHTHELGRGTR